MDCYSRASKMFALLCFLSLIYVSSAQNTVSTSVGPVTGTPTNGAVLTNLTYIAFKNIPYAQAPTSSLRFKATYLYNTTSSSTVNSKSNSTIACPQPGVPTGVTADEDCLYLNVYTPSDASVNKTYPVMVWIHGGFFIFGYGAMYNPEFLIEQKVVVVTINYRLGALGFLSLGNEDAPGNAGLKDQLIALTWVKNEISKFGGDANKITLFGQDAGSASVHHHILSALSKGSFHRAIMESGALEEWCYLETGFTDRARTFAQQLGCLNNNNVNFSCLAQASVANITDAQVLPLSNEDVYKGSLVSFPPVKEEIAANAFQQETFQNLMTNPVANPVSAIMGINKDEGLFGVKQNDNFYNSFFENLEYFIPQSVRSQLTTEEKNTRINNLKNVYFSDNKRPSLANLAGYIKLYKDKVFAYPTYAAAQALTRGNVSSHVYLYQFDYDGLFRNPNSDAFKIFQIAGVNHGDEVGYLFYLGYSGQAVANTEAFNIMTKMTRLWSLFATNGDPNPTTTDAALNVKWVEISNSSQAYFSINTDLSMSSNNTMISQATIDIWTALAAAHSASIYLQPTTAMIIIAALIAKYCSL